MKKRIAKKVLDDPRQYDLPQYKRACKRLGNPWIVGIDMAAEGTTDYTVKTTGSVVVSEEDTLVSNPTIDQGRANKFHYRTGQAPMTPGAIQVITLMNRQGGQVNDITVARDLDGMAIQVTPFNYEAKCEGGYSHDYSHLTISQMRDEAKVRCLDGYEAMNETELVKLLYDDDVRDSIDYPNG